MKTGELLITVHKNDITYLLKDLLAAEHNKLSPWADLINSNLVPVAADTVLREIAGDSYVADCLKIIASPASTLNMRICGPANVLSQITVCTSNGLNFAILTEKGDSFDIMYADNGEDLACFLTSLFSLDHEIVVEPVFPEKMDFESFILFANIIDSYRYITYREALVHNDHAVMKLTIAEFNNLLKESLSKLDMRWMISSLVLVAPQIFGHNGGSSESNYTYLFDNGWLLGGKDKDNESGEEYLLLNVNAMETGYEFLQTWYQSAGIGVNYLENDEIRKTPLVFISSTLRSHHVFLFDNAHDSIKYLQLDNNNSNEVFSRFIAILKNQVPSETKSDTSPAPAMNFCFNCGSILVQKARFCGKCGAEI